MAIETFRRFGSFNVEPLAKGAAPTPGDGEALLAKIGGVISSEAVDVDDEVVLQDGVDWSYFEANGWFNYDHGKGADNILGYPERVIRDGSETRVEGHLLLSNPKARSVYDLAQSLAKSNSPRKVGFSVEGRVLERDPKDRRRILKSQVLYVAITPTPVNTSTNMELIKSLARACDAGEQMVKGVGYQTPASGGGTLGALVPQSIAGRVSHATYAGQIRRMWPKATDEEVELVLKTLWPDEAVDLP